MATFTIALQTDKTRAEYEALAAAAARYGFDGLSVFADLGFGSPFPPLAVMAPHAPALRLGVACQNPSLVHPVEIATGVATLAALAGPRVYCGLARGAWLGGFGLADDRPIRRLGEAIDVVRAVLQGDDSGYAGEIYQLPPGFRLTIDPPGAVDLLIGTWGEQTARMAARRRVDEIKIGGSANPAMVRQLRTWIGPHTDIVAGAVTVCDADREAARRLARQEVALYLDVVGALDPTVAIDPAVPPGITAALATGDPDRIAGSVPDELLDLFAFAGTPQDIANQAAALVEAGASRIEFGTPHGFSPVGGVELLGSQTLPALAGLREADRR